MWDQWPPLSRLWKSMKRLIKRHVSLQCLNSWPNLISFKFSRNKAKALSLIWGGHLNKQRILSKLSYTSCRGHRCPMLHLLSFLGIDKIPNRISQHSWLIHFVRLTVECHCLPFHLPCKKSLCLSPRFCSLKYYAPYRTAGK